MDISHAYINCTYNNAHLINELKTMGPLSEHIHMHDSFGIIELLSTDLTGTSEGSTFGAGGM